MNIQSLTELLVLELQDLYDAEQQLLKALPAMAEGAAAEELRQAFLLHATETEQHARRLEEAFQILSVQALGNHCRAVAGLIKEAAELLESTEGSDPSALDAALILAAQKVEHFEIASYGGARTFAETLGLKEVERLLQETLDEETATDRKLTNLAVSAVNLDAAESDAEMAEDAR